MYAVRSSLLLVALGLVACSGGKSDDTSVAGDTASSTDSSSSGDDTSTDDTGVAGGARLTGTVVFDDGSPGSGVQVRFCLEICRFTNTDASGGFSFEQVETGTYAIELVKLGDEDYAIPLAPLVMVDGEQRDLSVPILVPTFADKQELTAAGEVDLDGLVVSADPASFTASLNSPSQDAYVAGVQVDPNTAGLPFDNLNGSVLAMWYLGNFHAETGGWAFKVQDRWNLPASTQLEAYVSDYDSKSWESIGTASVGSDGWIASDEGSGIPLLTTLILVEP